MKKALLSTLILFLLSSLVWAYPDGDQRAVILKGTRNTRELGGLPTALLLESLGTPREVIMDDYIHSRRITPKLKVQEDWIQVVFARIDQSGGIDNYLTEIGVVAAQRQAVKKNLEQK